MHRTTLLLGMLLILVPAGRAFGQVPGDRLPEIGKKKPDTDEKKPAPLDRKEEARAKFAASQPDLRKMSRERLEAVQEEFEARFKEFVAGRGTLDFLLNANSRRLQSELAVAPDDASRLAAFERHWRFASEVDSINMARFDAGRVPITDYSMSRAFRLDAQIKLVEAKARLGKAVRRRPVTGSFPSVELKEYYGPSTRRYFAAARFEAEYSEPAQLARVRIEVVRMEFNARFKNMLAGRTSLIFLIGSSLRLLEPELALARNPTDRLAAFERHWQFASEDEMINRARYEAGRIPITDYAESQYIRLEAEIWLAQARAQVKDNERILAVWAFPIMEDEAELSPLLPGRLARPRWEAQQAIPTNLLRERLVVARIAYEEREKEFLAGRGTLDFLLTASQHLRDSEWAISNQKSDRIAAQEKHLEHTRLIERVNRRRFEKGQVPSQDLALSRYSRLDGEIGLLQEKQKKDRK